MAKDKRKNLVRSALSGRIVNGKEVVMTEEVIEYLKKQGYLIYSPHFQATIHCFTYCFLLLGGYLIWV